MARLTRHELKQDEFLSAFEEFQQVVREHYKSIAAGVGIALVVGGSVLALKIRAARQEERASFELATALRTFRAYVGPSASDSPLTDTETFLTAQEKYKKALTQFAEVVRKFPRTRAAAIALYHRGVCQAQLGDGAGAIGTLREASRTSDRAIAALAELALAGELAKSGRLQEAVKIYQNLADHPTLTVPRGTALLEMASAYRPSEPARARRIYEDLEKEFASDPALAQSVKQHLTSLPP